MKFTVPCILACILCISSQVQCARILASIPMASYSHQIPWRQLWIELTKKGHEVVLITPMLLKNMNIPNFTQIDHGNRHYIEERPNYIEDRFKGVSWLTNVETRLQEYFHGFSASVLGHPEVQKMIAPDSNEKFDVIMLETLYTPAVFSLAHRFNAPLIGLSSLGLISFTEHALGGFVLPSHEYTWEMEEAIGPNLSFWQRLKNYLRIWWHVYFMYHYHLPAQQAIAEKYMGNCTLPRMMDIMKNMSLLFVVETMALTPARPKLPNMITCTSSHINEDPPPASKELKHVMDTATEGFIYFSLGSNAMSSDLPKETRQIFLDVFATLPYRVIWKYENELKNKPDNVYTAPWLPQQRILAHPNIKLFLYQGGLQSTEEAVHSTVPVIAFPVLADQDYQAFRMETLRVGKRISLLTLTREELKHAITEMITNKEYKENMIRLKSVINDRPHDLVKNLVWWTEYVIRHRGAPHLRSSLARQPWYNYCDMDIVVFFTVVALILISIAIKVIAKLVGYSAKQNRSSLTGQKQKIS